MFCQVSVLHRAFQIFIIFFFNLFVEWELWYLKENEIKRLRIYENVKGLPKYSKTGHGTLIPEIILF